MGSEKNLLGYYYEMASNNIGIRLSTVAYDENNPCPIDNFANINYPVILTDSTNWTRISGSIIADSAYDYLIVGNFFDDSNTDTMGFYCSNCLNNYSYYLIDDICVSTDSLLCNGGIDVLPCLVGINEINSLSEIRIFPNPATDKITISIPDITNPETTQYNIFNMLGEKLKTGFITENNYEIDIFNLPEGLYVIEITSGSKKVCKKLLKVR